MALDFMAIASMGAFPTPTPADAARAAYAASYGLLGTFPSGIALANFLTSNPRVIAIAEGSLMIGPLFVKLIQWVDSNSDIADDDDLEFTMDGSTVTVKPQLNLTNPVNGVAYENNFGGNAFEVSGKMFVTTIDRGQLLVWLK